VKSIDFLWRHVANKDEMDENGHISNITYLRWIQEAARAHSDAVGMDRSFYEQLGATFIVRRHEIDYKQGCVAGDPIEVTTSLIELRAASGERRTRIVKQATGAVLVESVTEWVFVSLSNHRPKRIPKEVYAMWGVEMSVAPRERNPTETMVSRS
jgi:acyl-CoA thioester hydrolase